VRLPR
jgi:hypothetical protein